MLRHVHRGVGPHLAADLGFVWRLTRGLDAEAVYRMVWTKRGENLLQRTNTAVLGEQAVRFARQAKSPDDPHLLFTAVEALGRPVGVMAFLRPGNRFGRIDARFGMDAAEILGTQLNHRERERVYETRERIVRKVLLEVRPADILYQVLHGLKRLLRYDHSATVLTLDRSERTLTVRAEIIAWKKAKGTRIGTKIPLDPLALEFIDSLETSQLVQPPGSTCKVPENLLREISAVAPDAPEAHSHLFARLSRREEPVGLLVIRTLAADAFVAADRRTIDSFLHIISAAAVHSEFFRVQQDRLMEAERSTTLGELARAISHDLSNSFGVIQPLLETLRRDASEGRLTADQLEADLQTLSQYVGTSLRIFQGLLSFARGSVEEAHDVDLVASIDAVLLLLGRGLRTQGIEVERRFEPSLPRLHARRQDMEQLFLNLLNNARESMDGGGKLTLSIWREKEDEGEAIRLSIADTGRGIPASLLTRVFEPFFTTKQGGTGLGLDICRSIVWEYNGALWLESIEGSGTVVQIRLPLPGSPESPATEVE